MPSESAATSSASRTARVVGAVMHGESVAQGRGCLSVVGFADKIDGRARTGLVRRRSENTVEVAAG